MKRSGGGPSGVGPHLIAPNNRVGACRWLVDSADRNQHSGATARSNHTRYGSHLSSLPLPLPLTLRKQNFFLSFIFFSKKVVGVIFVLFPSSDRTKPLGNTGASGSCVLFKLQRFFILFLFFLIPLHHCRGNAQENACTNRNNKAAMLNVSNGCRPFFHLHTSLTHTTTSGSGSSSSADTASPWASAGRRFCYWTRTSSCRAEAVRRHAIHSF